MDLGMIGVLILAGAVVASRFISESGLALLSDAEKTRLINDFSTVRKTTPVLVFGLVGVSLMKPDFASPPVVLLLFASLMLGIFAFSVRKIRALDLPNSYLLRYGLSQVLVIAAVGAYLALIPR